MATVLVTDGETRAALASVRSLARAGHTVHVAAARLPCLAGASRFTTRGVRVPPARAQPAEFVADVERYVAECGAGVVLPVTDAATSAILHLRGNRVGPAIVAGPGCEAYDRVSDKVALLGQAGEVGIAVPESVVVPDRAGVLAAARTVGFPCVLKPRRSVVTAAGDTHAGGVQRVASENDLDDRYPESAFPLIVQRWVPGHGEGLFLLLDHGRTLAAFAHRRLREKPPGGGVSVYREAMALPPELLARSEQLLRSMGWHGAAMVEFRRASRLGDTTPYLMEVNGRLWGSVQLAIDAGVDFPAMVVALALGQPITPVSGYRVGVRSRWFWGDVDHTLKRFSRTRAQLWLGPDAPSRAHVIWEFLRFRRRDREEVFDLRDPRPFLRETIDWVRGKGT